MASIHSIPRFLLPRGPLLLRAARAGRTPNTLLPISALRHASSKSTIPPRPKSLAEKVKDKTPVMPQPDKYRPPSHGRRTPRSETYQRSYGPKLTAEDRERMRTKKYPNMMSPEGSFSHWFIHHRALHAYISLGILLSLGIAAWYMDFMAKTIFGDLIPTKKEFLRHPFESIGRFIEVYKMHMAHTTQLGQQERLKREEDVQKRKQYRLDRIREAEERGEEYVEDPRYYVGEDGVRRRRVKRWFGIWE